MRRDMSTLRCAELSCLLPRPSQRCGVQPDALQTGAWLCASCRHTIPVQWRCGAGRWSAGAYPAVQRGARVMLTNRCLSVLLSEEEAWPGQASA